MHSRWFARLFFVVVAAFAVAGVFAGTACTRWGQPGASTPTLAPLSALFVDAKTGSDATGNGSMGKPFKTLTKAVEVLTSSKSLSPSGVTITLESGDYNAANGEKFPIIIPTSVSLIGMNYGTGPLSGAFINGIGEDTTYENLVHAPPRSAYATLDIAGAANVTIQNLYVGSSKISLPGSRATYASVDTLATLIGMTSTFGAGIVSLLPNVGGVLVAGGTFTCHSCEVRGNDFAIGALSVPITTIASPSASPGPVTPSVTLDHSSGDSVLSAKVVDILTDGSVNVTATSQTFARAEYAYSDVLAPVFPVLTRGAIDFGGGVAKSTGGNVFIGARTTEIFITRRSVVVSALDDVWNPRTQGSNRNGQYLRMRTFRAGEFGRNVSIRHDAFGSVVMVGPAPIPTPTPSISPSTSPVPTPTSSPT